MARCGKCIGVIDRMQYKSPKGYVPFGWGPNTEFPLHYYVYPESEPDSEGFRKLLNVVKVCEIEDPQIRVEARELWALRELLWFHHGCDMKYLYGDDGEMQCNNIERHLPIDFKRDSPEMIMWKIASKEYRAIFEMPDRQE